MFAQSIHNESPRAHGPLLRSIVHPSQNQFLRANYLAMWKGVLQMRVKAENGLV